MSNKSCIAIIPARGGSKRIPGKNIRPFLGKPIILYSIEAAIKADLFEEIMVSTDDPEIARVAESAGAKVPFLRPAELSDDYVGLDDVMLHSLNWLVQQDKTFDFFCCILATVPFVLPEYLQRGFELIQEAKVTSVFPVSAFPIPAFQAYKINGAGKLESLWPGCLKERTQDSLKTYYDAGQFYWADTQKYLALKEKNFSEDTVPIVLPRHLVVDIDTPDDWEIAEVMYQVCKKKGLL